MDKGSWVAPAVFVAVVCLVLMVALGFDVFGWGR